MLPPWASKYSRSCCAQDTNVWAFVPGWVSGGPIEMWTFWSQVHHAAPVESFRERHWRLQQASEQSQTVAPQEARQWRQQDHLFPAAALCGIHLRGTSAHCGTAGPILRQTALMEQRLHMLRRASASSPHLSPRAELENEQPHEIQKKSHSK